MSYIGEVRRGRDLGYVSNSKFMWVACPQCGKERWVEIYKTPKLCRTCNHKRTMDLLRGRCKESRYLNPCGYYILRISQNNPFYSMSSHGNIFEHRYVMATFLGRLLKSDEIVHHKNGKKSDNCIENLQLSHNGEHLRLHQREMKILLGQVIEQELRIKQLESRVTLLEAENTLLNIENVEQLEEENAR